MLVPLVVTVVGEEDSFGLLIGLPVDRDSRGIWLEDRINEGLPFTITSFHDIGRGTGGKLYFYLNSHIKQTTDSPPNVCKMSAELQTSTADAEYVCKQTLDIKLSS